MPDHPLEDLGPVLREAMTGTSNFGHREHLHLAWLAIQRDGLGAEATLVRWLRTIAERHEAPERFHVTVTAAWVKLVNHHLVGDRGSGGFQGFITRNPGLLDASLVGQHYADGTLQTPAAKQGWVPPDRVPLPVP